MYYVEGVIALLIRLYFGWSFLSAGLEKWRTGFGAQAVSGYLKGALGSTAGAHPNVSATWAWLIRNILLPNAAVFAFLVKTGEVLVGVGLILGLFTHLAAGFGMLMNFSYLLSGTLSTNPQMVLGFLLLFLFGSASYMIGLDRFIIPRIVHKDREHRNPWGQRFFPLDDYMGLSDLFKRNRV